MLLVGVQFKQIASFLQSGLGCLEELHSVLISNIEVDCVHTLGWRLCGILKFLDLILLLSKL